MALSGCFVRGIGIISRSIECRKSFMRLKSALTSPQLFVSGVSSSTTDEKIREAFARFRNLVEAKVIKDRLSGRSKGFAIVTYDNLQQAEKARRRMNFARLGDTVLIVESELEFSQEEEPVIPKPGCSVYLDLDDMDESQGIISFYFNIRYYGSV
ncbi:RRM domain-containing protein [Heracleum sosnowskyi]|uniref:RRM domain-containing protein n=1 Tax=Heracleum sosnowskyi TaxID=360622 RepID=A0AAD8N5P1_9APIA|nr:RRM domain-containing protein [Heracleum sosnowskyi]